MTLERDLETSDLFGLEGTFPRPGWVVLDAARSHGFTGELTFDTIPSAQVYLDSGEIYLAERVTDPPLGSRLVDAGALNAAQLEHGQMTVGETAHLGRLFERVPSVNRDNVLLVTEMMTEECVGWLADQLVRDAVAAPYHHHPAGIQRWLQPVPTTAAEPGFPLPTPTADEAPLDMVVSEPAFSPVEPLDDSMIQWEHPSWLDEGFSDDPVVLADAESGDHGGRGEASPPTAAAVASDALDPSSVWAQPLIEQAVSPDAGQPGPDAAWLTTPPSPVVALPADPAPVVDEPASLDHTESETAWPDPVAATDDWAGLIAAVAEPTDSHTALESADSAEAIIADLASTPTLLNHETITVDSPPIEELDGLDADLDSVAPPVGLDDWVDRLDTEGLPDAGTDPLNTTNRLPPVGTAPLDRFEVIWPSGEIDDQFETDGTPPLAVRRPNPDRVGTTARLGMGADDSAHAPTNSDQPTEPTEPTDPAVTGDEFTDELVLAVRRAVATIETGSLTARRRLVTSPQTDDPSRGIDDGSARVLTPLRHDHPAADDASGPVLGAARHRAPTRSVFDDDVPVATEVSDDTPSTVASPPAHDRSPRVGALKRLIGTLRRD